MSRSQASVVAPLIAASAFASSSPCAAVLCKACSCVRPPALPSRLSLPAAQWPPPQPRRLFRAATPAVRCWRTAPAQPGRPTAHRHHHRSCQLRRRRGHWSRLACVHRHVCVQPCQRQDHATDRRHLLAPLRVCGRHAGGGRLWCAAEGGKRVYGVACLSGVAAPTERHGPLVCRNPVSGLASTCCVERLTCSRPSQLQGAGFWFRCL